MNTETKTKSEAEWQMANKLVMELEQEVSHLKQILWATVRAVGGVVHIPYTVWTGRTRTNALHFSENKDRLSIVVEAWDEQESKGV